MTPFSFILFFVFSILSVIFRGFVISQLWQWFIVPQFGLKPLPVLVAVGLTTLIQILMPPTRNETKTDELWVMTFAYFFVYLLLWSQGYIIHLIIS